SLFDVDEELSLRAEHGMQGGRSFGHPQWIFLFPGQKVPHPNLALVLETISLFPITLKRFGSSLFHRNVKRLPIGRKQCVRGTHSFNMTHFLAGSRVPDWYDAGYRVRREKLLAVLRKCDLV